MTTVQTTLIPNSNRSQKQVPESYQQAKTLLRGHSAQERAGQDQSLTLQPFTVESSGTTLYNKHRESSLPASIPQQPQNAYREFVMKQARRQLGIDNQQLLPHISGEQTLKPHHRQSETCTYQTQHSRSKNPNKMVLHKKQGNLSFSQKDLSRILPPQGHQSSPNGTSSHLDASLLPQQKFLSTGTNLRSELNFENVTPGKYEETEQPYTYSMYTETVMGQDMRSDKTKSRRVEGFSSIGGGSMINCAQTSSAQNNNGQYYALQSNYAKQQDQLGQPIQPYHTNQQLKGSSPPNEPNGMFAEGQETAMFAKQQLEILAATGKSSGIKSNNKQKPPVVSLNRNYSSMIQGQDAAELSKPAANLNKKSRHVHSDSIMSAQFQADSVHQMLSQDCSNRDQQKLFQGRDNDFALFSQRDKTTDRRQSRDKQHIALGGLASVNSFDRKTFTLGEKGPYGGLLSGHAGLTSKTDMQSAYPNLVTSPTDQVGAPQPINPMNQLNDLQKQNSQPLPQESDREVVMDQMRSSRDVSSDLREFLQYQQQNQQTRTMNNDQNTIVLEHNSMQNLSDNISAIDRPQQFSSQIDFALSQPYQISDHLNSLKTLERGSNVGASHQPLPVGHHVAGHHHQKPNNQKEINSHRPQLVNTQNAAQQSNKHQRSCSNPKATNNAQTISDPSISITNMTNQSQTNNHNHQTQQHHQHHLYPQQNHPQQQQYQHLPFNSLGSSSYLPARVHPHLMSAQMMQYNSSGNNQQHEMEAVRLQSMRNHQTQFMQQAASMSPHRMYQVNPMLSLNTQRAQRAHELSMDQTVGGLITETTPLSQRNFGPDGALFGNNNNLMTLQHNLSQVTTGTNPAAPILKQEVIMLRRQLNDARNSNLFLKKQTLQLQHQINMQAISINQLEQAVGAKDSCQEEDQEKMNMLEAKYDEQRMLGDQLVKKQEETEELYKERLQNFADEIDHMRQEKTQSAYRIQANVMQLQSAMQHLGDIACEQSSYLTPFVNHFDKVCQTLMAQLHMMTQQQLNDYDDQSQKDGHTESRQQLKVMKRAHNFEKFRKEIRNLCKSHYRSKIQDRDIELEKSLKHSKAQEKQIKKLEEVCHSMHASYQQAQENIRNLTDENRQLANSFDTERLRLEKAHLKEVARLHKAVKNMQKRAHAFDQQCNQKYARQRNQTKSSVDLDTVGSQSEIMTTIDTQLLPLSTLPSHEQLPSAAAAAANYQSQSADTVEENQLLKLQNEQFRQTLEGQGVLIQELHKALVSTQEMHHQQLQEQQDSYHHAIEHQASQEQSSCAGDSSNAQPVHHQHQQHQVLFYRADGSYSVSADYIEPDQSNRQESQPQQQQYQSQFGREACYQRDSTEKQELTGSIEIGSAAGQGRASTEPEIQIINEQQSDDGQQSHTDEKVTLSEHHNNFDQQQDQKKQMANTLNFRDLQYLSSQQEDANVVSIQQVAAHLESQSQGILIQQPSHSSSAVPTEMAKISSRIQ